MPRIELLALRLPRSLAGRRAIIRAIERCIIAAFGKPRYAEWSDHVSRLLMAQGAITDQVQHLYVRANPWQSRLDGLLDEPPIGAPRAVSPMLIFAPVRSAPLPMRPVLGHLWRGVGGLPVKWCQHHRVGGAAFDTAAGYTQNPQPTDHLPTSGGKHPLPSVRGLARCRHHHVIATPQDHLLGLQQMGPNQHPWERGPTAAGAAKPLARPVTAPFAGPACHTPHRHAAGP
jgi:hypothetical protein